MVQNCWRKRGQRTYCNEDVGVEGNIGLDSKGEWSKMVSRHVLRQALEFEVKGKRKRGRPKQTWKTQVEKESKSWFGEGRRNELSEMESGSWRDCS